MKNKELLENCAKEIYNKKYFNYNYMVYISTNVANKLLKNIRTYKRLMELRDNYDINYIYSNIIDIISEMQVYDEIYRYYDFKDWFKTWFVETSLEQFTSDIERLILKYFDKLGLLYVF